jgi:hypothetical protein
MRKTWALVLVPIAFAVGCQSSSSGSSSGTSGTTSSSSSKAPAAVDHAEDVTITACTADTTTGYLDAKVKVTNHSSKTSNYAITIAFESKDGSEQLDTGIVAVNNLAPGQSSDQDAVSLKSAPAGGYNCKLADLTRYAS